jgi:hypothetical protein
LRGEASVSNFSEREERVSVESYGERGVFADLVLHGSDGLVEGVDDKVRGSGSNDVAKVIGLVVNGQGDSSSNVRGYGEGCARGVESKGKDERTAPV